MATIEFLILADFAEAIGAKLYLQGAGWSVLTRTYREGDHPMPTSMGIAISVLVPWIDANRAHRLTLKLEAEDGGAPIANLTADVETGRPAGTPEGSDLRAMAAISAMIVFPKPGGYRILADFNPPGEHTQRTVSFTVQDQMMEGPIAPHGPFSR